MKSFNAFLAYVNDGSSSEEETTAVIKPKPSESNPYGKIQAAFMGKGLCLTPPCFILPRFFKRCNATRPRKQFESDSVLFFSYDAFIVMMEPLDQIFVFSAVTPKHRALNIEP